MKKTIFEEGFRKFCDLQNFVTTFPHFKCEVLKWLQNEEYSPLSWGFFWKSSFKCPCLLEEEYVWIPKEILQNQNLKIFLFHHLYFKACLKNWTLGRHLCTSSNSGYFVPFYPYLACEVLKFVEHKAVFSFSNSFDFNWISHSAYHLSFKEELLQTFDELGLLCEILKYKSFHY